MKIGASLWSIFEVVLGSIFLTAAAIAKESRPGVFPSNEVPVRPVRFIERVFMVLLGGIFVFDGVVRLGGPNAWNRLPAQLLSVVGR